MFLVMSICLSLFGCEYVNEWIEKNGVTENQQSNNTEKKNMYYYSVKTLYSYEDVMDALDIVRQRKEVKPTYTVTDMGENYTIFYQFWTPHNWTEYPIDYETYFTTKSILSISS